MTKEPDGSVTRWIGDLVAGDAAGSAAQKLWERYFDRLVHLARDRLRAGPAARRTPRTPRWTPSTASAAAPPPAASPAWSTATTSGRCW